ncbi:UDP-N-acetylmuramate--L-alanine ligase [Myroides sp. LJL119]
MRIHFIAIGGSAMHNLALAMHERGDLVTGSDDIIFEPSKSRLKAKSLLPKSLGWFPENINTEIDAVILGMHARSDNPELLKAQELGLKIYSYPEFIFEESKGKTRVVIGGSHGKTTITAMVLHVMSYHDISIDYLVGAQLEGFERMVHLTNKNEFILIEGDEYLSSAIDSRPKFHLYQPNIALISGIAWDHINVFPTLENYIEQFSTFIDKIVDGGILVYNQQDSVLDALVSNSLNPIRKIPYSTAEHFIENGITYLQTPDGDMPLEIFGEHNLSNLQGAKWVCQNMGVDEEDFYEAIASFKGASKRLEKLVDKPEVVVFKDFAHSPSKVKATVEAVKKQYPNKKLVALLELHTYSSLNKDFLINYNSTLDSADKAVVFFSQEALKIKKINALNEQEIRNGFSKEDLLVYSHSQNFDAFLQTIDLNQTVLLFMSSGNYGGLDLNNFIQNRIT